MKRVKVGVIGCGNISIVYMKNLTGLFETTEIAAVYDIDMENAARCARQYNVHACSTLEELLALDEVEIALILTNPEHHAGLCVAALNAGKHVFVEKPLALSREEGLALLELARSKGLRLSCAPDTLLGSGMQTARKLIDDGWIGRPYAAMCHMLYHGPECWHPNPAFLYQKGAGVMFDVGPYFIAGLAYLLGPVESVAASCRITFAERLITSEPRFGEKIKVEVPTFINGLLNFASGTLASLVLTFDVRHTTQRNHLVEIYGTEGTLSIPSPCGFDGETLYKKDGMSDWSSLPSLFPYKTDSRGIGVADMSDAILNGRPHRIAADLAYHTLDVMQGFYESHETGRMIKAESVFERTEPINWTCGQKY